MANVSVTRRQSVHQYQELAMLDDASVLCGY